MFYKICFQCSGTTYVETDKKMDVAGMHVAFGVLLTASLLRMKINTGPKHCSLNLGVHRKYLFHLRCLGFRESS
jgi:hypothetical protein